MKTIKTIALSAALLALAASANAGPMKPGKWQITVTTVITGIEASIPPTTITECVTADEAANPQPPETGQGSDCTIADYKINGNSITWSVSCPKENLTGTGTMTFAGDAYTGATRMKIGDTAVTQKLAGTRLGDCDK